MSLIEGIGDEVTVLAACLIVLAVVVIGWISTRVDVRTHTSVVIIDRERFSELLRRVRGVAIRANLAGMPAEAGDAPISADAAGEVNPVAESLLPPTAAAAATAQDKGAGSCSSDGDSVDLSCDGAQTCSRDAEASASCNNAETESSAHCETSSSMASTSSQWSAVGAAADNLNMSPNNSSVCGDMPPGSVQIRLQFVDGRQKTVYANPDDTIGHFKRNHFASELASNFVVRFIAGGQELKDETSTLRSHQIAFSGAVLHCLVTPARPTAPPADDRQNAGPQFDIGILMFPLFGTMLVALWYARIVYRSYFNGTSTFSLLAISFLYIVALLATLRGDGHAEHHAHVD